MDFDVEPLILMDFIKASITPSIRNTQHMFAQYRFDVGAPSAYQYKVNGDEIFVWF